MRSKAAAAVIIVRAEHALGVYAGDTSCIRIDLLLGVNETDFWKVGGINNLDVVVGGEKKTEKNRYAL